MVGSAAQASDSLLISLHLSSVTVSLLVCLTGMNKMVINHLEKLFVTRDASTIINELEVEHPAARLLVFAAQAQQQEIGDGTNFVRFLRVI